MYRYCVQAVSSIANETVVNLINNVEARPIRVSRF